MVRYELLLPGGGPAIPLTEAPITVGRAPANAVVVSDDSVSWHHAQLWLEGGFAWVRDLGSRNGTFLNGERIVASTRVAASDELRVGATAILGVRASGDAPPSPRTRHVEDLAAGGIRVLVRSDRFLLGSAPDCDLRVDDWPARAATIVAHDNGELWLGTDADEDAQLQVGVPFAVLGRPFRIVEDTSGHAPTVELSSATYPYSLTATANAPGGPMVTLTDTATGRSLGLTGNRGVLLFVLARQVARDREAGKGLAEQGWCTTEEVLVGVWGRGAKDANHLNVLVHRLRGHLTAEGFDPWFVEKRRGGIRVKVRDVTLT